MSSCCNHIYNHICGLINLTLGSILEFVLITFVYLINFAVFNYPLSTSLGMFAISLPFPLSIQVGCRGVVLIRLSSAAAVRVDPVEVLRAVLGDLERGALQPPRWWGGG